MPTAPYNERKFMPKPSEKLNTTLAEKIRSLPRAVVVALFVVLFFNGELELTVPHLIGAVVLWLCICVITQVAYEEHLARQDKRDPERRKADRLFLLIAVTMSVLVGGLTAVICF